MRPDPFESLTRSGGARRRALRPGPGRKNKSSLRRIVLEGLEDRTLMAVLPAPDVLRQVAASNQRGIEFQPSVAVDPTNPLHAVTAYTQYDPINNPNQISFLDAAFTTDGGNTWTQFSLPGLDADPTTSNPTLPYRTNLIDGVGFDRSGNLYVLESEYSGPFNGANLPTPTNIPASGEVRIDHFRFNGAPSFVSAQRLYQYVGGDSFFNPTLAVDSNLASFSDTTDSGQVQSQSDPFSGNVYVAWQTNNIAPASNPTNFNPQRIRLFVSNDQGQTYSGAEVLDPEGDFGAQRNGQIKLTVSQGTADGRVPPGQVQAVWVDNGSLATNNPPTNIVRTDSITAGLNEQFGAIPGPITDATDPGNGAPHIPGVTDFPINVNITDPRFINVSDATLELDLVSPNDDQLSARLIPPAGSGLSPITLFVPQTNPAGTQNQAIGISGANIGVIANNGVVQYVIGTVFDDHSPRDIVDPAPGGGRGASAPYFGHYRPEFGSLDAPVASGGYGGATPAQVNGQWTLEITDTRNSGNPPPPEFLVRANLTLRSGLVSLGAVSAAFPLQVLGPIQNTGATVVPVNTAPVIAADNTLGSFSPYQGRLYLAYVDRINNNNTPTDNTDIFLKVSDDDGRTWQTFGGTALAPGKLNDDLATSDGFSEDNSDLSGTGGVLGPNAFSGRPQFQPSLAVDQTTGTLVASWYDARYSGDRQRPAYFLATSIDGGQTFGPQVFANAPRQAMDAVTGKVVTLGPLPDNFSTAASGATNQTMTPGFNQGLAVADGHVYPVWSSNQDAVKSDDAQERIRVAPTIIATGPRIIDSTMGPVGQAGDTLNASRAADGGPQASAFTVTFDRPVDPSTFTVQDVQVFFRDTLPGNPTGGPVPVVAVTPLDLGFFGPAGAHGATRFRVDFAARSAPGTYSYAISPAIQDRIRSVTPIVIAGPTQTFPAGNVNLPIPSDNPTGNPNGDTGGPFSPPTDSSINVTTIPANQVVRNVTVNLTIRHTFSNDLVITLIAPDGTRIVLSQNEGNGEHTDGTAFTNTTFDDSATLPIAAGTPPFTGRFKPDQPLGLLQGRQPNGTWTLEIRDTAAVDVGTLVNWSLTIQSGTLTSNETPGNTMDQNANGFGGELPTPGQTSSNNDVYAAPRPLNGVTLDPTDPTHKTFRLSAPFDQDTLPLIVPGPHIATTFVPGQPASPDNLVLNATTNALDVTFDRAMNPATFTAGQVLRILGPAGIVPGPYTVTPDPQPGEDPNFPKTYKIGFPTQQLSGTYVVNLAASIQSESGAALDTNLNAGVDLLKGFATTGLTAPITYTSADTPAAIPDLKSVSSTITVPDSFVIQGLTLTLNITHARDPDLEAFLVAPDGTTKIQLFTNIGQTGTQANFTNTVFDDNAGTPIQNGGPPFSGSFQPQEPLSVLKGRLSAGTYTLVVQDDKAGIAGTLVNWSLTLLKPLPASGLGEPTADVATTSFRIFTMDPTNPLSSNTWTAVGPAPIGNSAGSSGGKESAPSGSGRIGGIAVDPSDPSGNTVYIGGASGGIWKTTNFLDPAGPTYVPLTDFGPTFAINIGGIAVFGRNNDPNQSIVFAATGEGDTGSPGVGFLRSMDGGATWTLLDSKDNTLPFAQRDHTFAKNGGTQSFKILVDPKPRPDGNVIVYAAISGANGGVWQSLDTGNTWTRLVQGQATDLVFDPGSGTGGPNGNLQTIYAAFRGDGAGGQPGDIAGGVYISTNQGKRFDLMTGGVGDPLIRDVTRNNPVGVANAGINPNGANGRIVLAKPALTGNVAQDLIYKGWLYALVINSDGNENGLYMTKDFGQNWVLVHTSTLPAISPTSGTVVRAVPSNDVGNPDYNLTGAPFAASGLNPQGNYDVSLAVDPTNPNIVYAGGSADFGPTGFIRVDATLIDDAHSLTFNDPTRNDAGTLLINSLGGVTADDPINLPVPRALPAPFFNPLPLPSINLIRDPNNPFVAGATIFVRNSAQFTNDGSGVKWKPFDIGGTDQHRIVTTVDPLTGHARIIIGDDQGVWSAVDDNGTFSDGIGTAPFADGSRNGNLQVTQFYYGAAQPSNLAAQVAQAFFYGSAQDNGGPHSDPNVLTNGNIAWTGPGGDATGVATDQTGSGEQYQYFWPCCGGNRTDFFQANGTGRTFGLLQQSNPGPQPDPQWPSAGGSNFAVNPLQGGDANGQIVMSSQAGRIFRTENGGRVWSVIGQPTDLDSSYAPAMAFGAPDPNFPGGLGNLDNFIYAGTVSGHIFVTQNGGGNGTSNGWINISAGLDGSPVQAIITNPTPGNHEAYAVTTTGVFHIGDSLAPGASWQNITGNLFSITNNPFGNSSFAQQQLKYLTSVAADWRYVIPADPAHPGGPTHPMLYAAGEGGVYRSTDNGQTWAPFPSQDPLSLNTTPNPPGVGGGLPDAHVTDLDVSLGNIDPTTGRPDVATGPNVLLATTYGRGSFAIRIAPFVFPTSLLFDPSLPAPGGSDSGPSKTDRYTNVTQPIIDGLSEQSAFGNVVTINLIDETDPQNPVVIGTGQTDAAGRFSIQVNPGVYKADGSTDGVKTIGVQAVNASGTKGNLASFVFTLDTQAPAMPGVPVLEAASDSGLSNSDDITKVTNPTFDISSVEPGTTTIVLLRDGVPVAQRLVTGPITAVQDPGPVPDGVHLYRARQVDLAGNQGPQSAPLSVTIDTSPPTRPPAPVLDPAFDSGVPGDNITNFKRPQLDGTTDADAAGGQVDLLDLAGDLIGQASVAANGSYTVQPFANLTDGTYTFQVRAEDVAGNTSPTSPTVTITVLTKAPAAPSLSLVPTDDSGVPGDNVTNVVQPHLTGQATPGLTVDLVTAAPLKQRDGTVVPAGAVLTSAIVSPAGSFLFQFPQALADGTIKVVARARDVAGNTSNSPVLTLQVLTQGPTTAPTLALSPADDTGMKGDNKTAVRRPHLTGRADPNVFVDLVGPSGAVLGSTISGPTGNFTVQLPSNLSNGTIALRVRVRDVAGNQGPPSAPLNLTVVSTSGDFDGDGKTDLAIFDQATATFTVLLSGGGSQSVQLGTPGDVNIPVAGDFDGDGKADLSIYDQTRSQFFIQLSGGGSLTPQFGNPAHLNIPIAADFDGDGRTDFAIYDQTGSQFFIILSGGGAKTPQFGIPSDVNIPVVGDYNGDGKADYAIYDQTRSQFFILFNGVPGAFTPQFGIPSDVNFPVGGDFNGDGKTDFAIYDQTRSQFFVLYNGVPGALTPQFGNPAHRNVPVAGDYDADGKTDVGIYDQTASQFFVLKSGGGALTPQFGNPAHTNIPIPSSVSARGLSARSIAAGGAGGSGGGVQFSAAVAPSVSVAGGAGGSAGRMQFSAAAVAPPAVPLAPPASDGSELIGPGGLGQFRNRRRS
jgi:large repetitive protein